MTDEQLRQLYQNALDRRAVTERADCVSPEALQALVERTAPEPERLRTLDHVMGCRACLAEFELLRAVTAAAHPQWTRYRHVLALAAALVLLLGGGLLWNEYRPVEREVMRGEAEQLTLLRPEGVVSARGPITLVWRPAIGVKRYVIDLFDAAGRVVFSATTTDTTLTLPRSLPHSPGGEYRWSARGTLADGAQVRSTTSRFILQNP